MAEVKGVLVPNITFFTEDDKMDDQLNTWHLNWMMDNGVNGVFATGSYGCGPLMTMKERIHEFKLAKAASEKHPGSFVIAHVGTADTASAVQLAKEAEAIGCDAVGAVPPFYYAFTEDEVIGYYAAIVKAVDIPVYAYNNPKTSRFTMNFNTVLRLQEVGVKGVKDSTMNVTFLTRTFYDAKLNHKDFKTIIGTSNGWMPFCLMGIDTMIAGMCNYAPEIMTAMYNYTLGEDKDKAEKAYKIMMDYLAKCRFADSTLVSHVILKARGFDSGYTRTPFSLAPFDKARYDQCAREFDEALAQMKALEE